jgi:tetratricopeptide (TPR) repeat protein
MKRFCLVAFLALKFTNPSFSQVNYLEIGNQYLNDEKYSEAEKTFIAAIGSDSNNLVYQCQLALSLIEQDKHKEAQKVIDHVLLKDSNNVGALWYGGMNNFQDKKGDLRIAVFYFEKAMPHLNEKQGQYYSANWFIGRSYQILLQSDGLTYNEVSRMLECYSIYLRLQPNADDASKIAAFVKHIKEIRPSDNVKKWVNLPQ